MYNLYIECSQVEMVPLVYAYNPVCAVVQSKPMNQLLIIITALIFYALGRYAGQEVEIYQKVRKRISKTLRPQPAGIIDFPTQDAVEYKGSEQEMIDRDMEQKIREQLKSNII